ncbi:molybdopterin molybdotransferase MoeA [Tanticharoenia sakaeratensis]|nr:molybdopterin molybdotransferase MoeA [Tanticharoenia sakaeratensis]
MSRQHGRRLMLEVSEAVDLIERHVGNFGTENIPLVAAAGRILRQAVDAERALPPYDRVMMDGIAVRHGEGRVFQVLGAQRAGMPAQRLDRDDACLEVTTGAVLPEGADAVIPVERLIRNGDTVTLEDGYVMEAGQFIHRRGIDCQQGARLLDPGLRLNAPALAVLAGNGCANVEVAKVPRIGIVSTGDELVAVDAPVREWEIRASNDHAIAGALRARGFDDVSFDRIVDDLDATVATLGALLDRCDVLVLSGGVSMGTFDYVPRAMEALGVTRIFHKIAQRPGKPMWFGVGPRGQRVFALPGNPVSALTCCVRYVVPALLSAQGLLAKERFTVRLDAEVALIPTLARFVPVRVHHDQAGQALAHPLPMPTSGDFNHLATTHGFVELPKGERAPPGTHAVFHGW